MRDRHRRRAPRPARHREVGDARAEVGVADVEGALELELVPAAAGEPDEDVAVDEVAVDGALGVAGHAGGHRAMLHQPVEQAKGGQGRPPRQHQAPGRRVLQPPAVGQDELEPVEAAPVPVVEAALGLHRAGGDRLLDQLRQVVERQLAALDRVAQVIDVGVAPAEREERLPGDVGQAHLVVLRHRIDHAAPAHRAPQDREEVGPELRPRGQVVVERDQVAGRREGPDDLVAAARDVRAAPGGEGEHQLLHVRVVAGGVEVDVDRHTPPIPRRRQLLIESPRSLDEVGLAGERRRLRPGDPADQVHDAVLVGAALAAGAG